VAVVRRDARDGDGVDAGGGGAPAAGRELPVARAPVGAAPGQAAEREPAKPAGAEVDIVKDLGRRHRAREVI
jgi:hypothetical protein